MAQVTADEFGRATFTPAMITAYFDRICLPHSGRQELTPTLEFLKQLQLYHLANVPFENLSLHYSALHRINLDICALYEKIVGGGLARGRGGYCMENNACFGTLLRSLGYDVYPTGARVNTAVDPRPSGDLRGPVFKGWNHMVNLVTIDGVTYFVDVGFGSAGPSSPMPLQDGYTTIGGGNTEVQVIRDIPRDLLRQRSSQSLWVYRYRHTGESDWTPAYCFSETEFLTSDFQVMSWYASTSPDIFFTQIVVCSKKLLDEQTQTIVGELSLRDRTAKKRIMGRTEESVELKDEAQRVRLLEEWFGIVLTSDEAAGIIESPSQIS